ncbi:MAG: fibronectin type III domain-containing protein [Candidatus Zixiibacteriota bacterium]|nr:MAG: fibronectin type III domain-containing protein [candidate division Zixibacteria bacterium]
MNFINGVIRPLLAVSVVFLFGFAGVVAQDAGEVDTVAVDSAAAIPPNVTPVMIKDLAVRDNPNDDGQAVRLNWHLSADDHEGGKVTSYRIMRATSLDGEYIEVGDVPAGNSSFIDNSTEDGTDYFYKIAAINSLKEDGRLIWSVMSESDPVGPVRSSAQWFDLQRINVFVGVIFVCSAILYFINRAKSGKALFIRKIAGLESVDEAVGRATEMGRKIFYIPGINDMDNVQTIAGVTILGRVAQLAAEYETWIEVPVCKSLVMITAKEIVKEAYAKVGRPDAFNDDQVHYLTDDQFGYAAAIDGMIVREKPATIFYMGAFFAESLIMAETGNASGAIQIAGTAMPSQLPFFVAACDYTLIGEELFAASAYLSREPRLLGSLKGQDVGKAVILIALIVGVVLESLNVFQFSRWFSVID